MSCSGPCRFRRIRARCSLAFSAITDASIRRRTGSARAGGPSLFPSLKVRVAASLVTSCAQGVEKIVEGRKRQGGWRGGGSPLAPHSWQVARCRKAGPASRGRRSSGAVPFQKISEAARMAGKGCFVARNRPPWAREKTVIPRPPGGRSRRREPQRRNRKKVFVVTAGQWPYFFKGFRLLRADRIGGLR